MVPSREIFLGGNVNILEIGLFFSENLYISVKMPKHGGKTFQNRTKRVLMSGKVLKKLQQNKLTICRGVYSSLYPSLSFCGEITLIS